MINMIYLKLLKDEKISKSLNSRKGDVLDAMYNNEKDRIVIFHAREDCIGLLNHEFMHKILNNNQLEKAGDCWDSKFIFRKVERWLGWETRWRTILRRF